MRKDPCAQINLRLDPELARKLKALSAISGRSLNALITLAVDEYVFLRRATVLQGQKIVDGYAGFDATLKPVRSTEEREALQAAQSQELKSAIEAERAAYEKAQAPTPLAGTQGQGVESVAPAAPVEEASQAEDAACMPWARAQDATQEESQDVPEAPSAPKTEALDAAPLAGTSQDPAPEHQDASQSGNGSEGQDAGQEEPSHMAGNQDPSQTVEAAPVAQKAVKDMSIEEKRARARELKAQGMTYQQIADAMGTNKSTAYHWANK